MIRFAEVMFVLGLLTFTYVANFDQYRWQVTYSLWDKGKDLLLFYLLSRIDVGTILRPIVWLCFVRVLWEVLSMATGVNVNASLPVSILFIIYCFYVLYTTAKNVRN